VFENEPIADEELIQRCQQGDLMAFEHIYRRYQRPILAYIYQIVRNYEDAGCIAQDVFMKVFERVDRFDTQRRFSTWFFTVARNACLDHLQARKRKAEVNFSTIDRFDGDNTILSTSAADVPDIEETLAGQEANDQLHQALAKLPQIYREIIELVIFQEMHYADAAEILGGISLGTLRSRMFHALRILRQHLTEIGGEHGEHLL
jgi:RNA polymerase sigma-70 factor (ECF subfamily)